MLRCTQPRSMAWSGKFVRDRRKQIAQQKNALLLKRMRKPAAPRLKPRNDPFSASFDLDRYTRQAAPPVVRKADRKPAHPLLARIDKRALKKQRIEERKKAIAKAEARKALKPPAKRGSKASKLDVGDAKGGKKDKFGGGGGGDPRKGGDRQQQGGEKGGKKREGKKNASASESSSGADELEKAVAENKRLSKAYSME